MNAKYDFYDPDYFKNGFPFDDLAALSQKSSLLHADEREDLGRLWFTLDYATLQKISLDHTVFSSEQKTILIDTPEGEELERQRHFLLNMDPPRHNRLRNIVSRAFTIKNINAHKPMIAEVVERVFEQLPRDTEIEVVTQISTPITLEVICRIMGVSTEDMDFINSNTNSMVYTDDTDFNIDAQSSKYSASQLFLYAMKLYEDRDSIESGSIFNILCNTLTDGDNITQEEFCFFFVFILAAGYETTRSMISNMLNMLANHPQAWQQLKSGAVATDNAVEEFLRFDPPVFQMCRTAKVDVEVGGCPVKQGEKIGMLYHAANRDEGVFNNPNELDLARNNANKHLSFGAGRHHCLGANLARIELATVLSHIVEHFQQIEILNVEHVRSNFINSIKSMPAILK